MLSDSLYRSSTNAKKDQMQIFRFLLTLCIIVTTQSSLNPLPTPSMSSVYVEGLVNNDFSHNGDPRGRPNHPTSLLSSSMRYLKIRGGASKPSKKISSGRSSSKQRKKGGSRTGSLTSTSSKSEKAKAKTGADRTLSGKPSLRNASKQSKSAANDILQRYSKVREGGAKRRLLILRSSYVSPTLLKDFFARSITNKLLLVASLLVLLLAPPGPPPNPNLYDHLLHSNNPLPSSRRGAVPRSLRPHPLHLPLPALACPHGRFLPRSPLNLLSYVSLLPVRIRFQPRAHLWNLHVPPVRDCPDGPPRGAGETLHDTVLRQLCHHSHAARSQ